jgi:hypothetical protein
MVAGAWFWVEEGLCRVGILSLAAASNREKALLEQRFIGLESMGIFRGGNDVDYRNSGSRRRCALPFLAPGVA